MSDMLWNCEKMAEAMEGRFVGTAPEAITGLSIDTRSLQQGEAYFAIKGDVHDGHKFVANAYAAGAAISVVSEEWLDQLQKQTAQIGPLLVVDDVLKGLERLGRAARARMQGTIIAVTGSVGKTSTKEALRTALEPSGKVHAAVASFNNHWGVPLTLARMPQESDFGVIEIGMNHPHEITPLVKMARPHIAMITNVAAVHLGAFKDVDEIAHAKAEIFDGLEAGGTAILNADDERFALLKRLAKEKGVQNIVGFGEKNGADTQLDKVVLHNSCSCLTASVLGDQTVIKVGVPGRHMAQNALAVLTAVKLAKADLARAGLALGDLQAVKGRGQRHVLGEEGQEFILIDESYNANPTSMKAALNLLGSASTKGRGRKIAVLGDMLELGSSSAELHASLAHAVLENDVAQVFLAGEEMKALKQELSGKIACIHSDSIEELVPQIRAILQAGDVIMAKASLGMRFALCVNDLLKVFSKEHLQKMS